MQLDKIEKKLFKITASNGQTEKRKYLNKGSSKCPLRVSYEIQNYEFFLRKRPKIKQIQITH